MRAVFLPGGRQVEIRTVDVPEPGPGEVLVALKAAGLCGSDLHMHYRPPPEKRRGPIFGLATDPDIAPGPRGRRSRGKGRGVRDCVQTWEPRRCAPYWRLRGLRRMPPRFRHEMPA